MAGRSAASEAESALITILLSTLFTPSADLAICSALERSAIVSALPESVTTPLRASTFTSRPSTSEELSNPDLTLATMAASSMTSPAERSARSLPAAASPAVRFCAAVSLSSANAGLMASPPMTAEARVVASRLVFMRVLLRTSINLKHRLTKDPHMRNLQGLQINGRNRPNTVAYARQGRGQGGEEDRTSV